MNLNTAIVITSVLSLLGSIIISRRTDKKIDEFRREHEWQREEVHNK